MSSSICPTVHHPVSGFKRSLRRHVSSNPRILRGTCASFRLSCSPEKVLCAATSKWIPAASANRGLGKIESQVLYAVSMSGAEQFAQVRDHRSRHLAPNNHLDLRRIFALKEEISHRIFQLPRSATRIPEDIICLSFIGGVAESLETPGRPRPAGRFESSFPTRAGYMPKSSSTLAKRALTVWHTRCCTCASMPSFLRDSV